MITITSKARQALRNAAPNLPEHVVAEIEQQLDQVDADLQAGRHRRAGVHLQLAVVAAGGHRIAEHLVVAVNGFAKDRRRSTDQPSVGSDR